MSRFLVFLVLLVSTSANAATVYEMNNGQLIGITEVDVNGVLYDVSFQSGSFDSIYGDPANLTFTNSADAYAASGVLLSMLGENIVGSDGAIYDFERSTTLVNGCGNFIYCHLFTTYGLATDISGVERATHANAINFYDAVSDMNVYGSIDRTASTPFWATYAVWAESATVPEASSLVLLGIGLLGIGFSRRRLK